EIEALFATTKPKAPDVNKKLIICSRVGFNLFFTANKTPGTIPAAPAVGVAQIVPIAALTSFVATALLTASNNKCPDKVSPLSIYCCNNTASPPVKPEVDCTPCKPFSTASSITVKF